MGLLLSLMLRYCHLNSMSRGFFLPLKYPNISELGLSWKSLCKMCSRCDARFPIKSSLFHKVPSLPKEFGVWIFFPSYLCPHNTQNQLLKPLIHQVNWDSMWALPPTLKSVSRKLFEGEETGVGDITCAELISWRGASWTPGGAGSAVMFADSLKAA